MPQSHLTHGLRAQHGHTAGRLRRTRPGPTPNTTARHAPGPPHRTQAGPNTARTRAPPQGLGSPTKADTPLARRTEPKQTQRPQPESKVQARARDPGGAPIYRTRRPTSPGRPDRAQQPGTRLSQKTAQQPPPLPEPKQYQHGPDQSRDPGRGTAPTA